MYYDEFFPFYAVYADPEVYARELQQEREAELMRARYPQTVSKLQDYIHEEADLMDYQGSRIYDEYPDPWMMRKEYERVENLLREKNRIKEMSDELLQVLFWQDISERRCRKQRCRGY